MSNYCDAYKTKENSLQKAFYERKMQSKNFVRKNKKRNKEAIVWISAKTFLVLILLLM